MRLLPIRLSPGADLRRELERESAVSLAGSAFVVAGIGSLSHASLRFASAEQESQLSGPFEIISLSGTLASNGAHIHMSVASSSGQVIGGHVGYGCVLRTTAEVLLVPLEGWSLLRTFDPNTGYKELQVTRQGSGTSDA